MKILITGATGFVGGALTRQLARNGYEVIATGRSSTSKTEIEKYGRFIQWDISEPMDKISVDVCIHSAGLADDQASYRKLYRANVTGTQNVIDSISCKRFIYISSSSVYPFKSKEHNENDPIEKHKLGNYGRTKYEGEEIVEKYGSNYDSCTMLRPRVIYGKGDRILVPRLINQSTLGKIKVPGDLEIQSSFCNINLLVKTVEEIMMKHNGFDIFNVTDPHIYTMKEAFEAILSHYHNTEIKFTHLPLSLLTPIAKFCDLLPWKTALSSMAIRNLSQGKILNSNKLYDFLEEKPLHNFYQELEDIISWYKTSEEELQNGKSSNLAWINMET